MFKQVGGYRVISHPARRVRTKTIWLGQITVICPDIIRILVVRLLLFKGSSSLLFYFWLFGFGSLSKISESVYGDIVGFHKMYFTLLQNILNEESPLQQVQITSHP